MAVRYHFGQFPPNDLDWRSIANPMDAAGRALARYDSFLDIIPDSDILIAPMLTKEAVSSSRIEGTRASVSDVLMFEAGGDDINPSMRNDVYEVLNYKMAIQKAESMLDRLPVSGRMLKEAHSILLEGVRGQNKSPGKYRCESNWIGPSDNFDEAMYIPPGPNDVEDLMSVWERFANSTDIPPLVKTALAHVEFESIHPFLDGNGRIGRMLIPLMLYSDQVISHPCFYLSEFFERSNFDYRKKLRAVSSDGAWTEWCIYFLNAVKTQAEENQAKAKHIFELYERTRSELLKKSGSSHTDPAVRCLFYQPIFPSNIFTTIGGLSDSTARRFVKLLKELKMIGEMHPHRGSRPAILVFPELLAITDGVDISSIVFGGQSE